MDRDRAIILATVQDRRQLVLRVLRQARSSLAAIWAVMFPLDAAPSTFGGLLAKFRNVGHVKELVRHQLFAGVKVALSLVWLHRHDVNLAEEATGPPLQPDGSLWDMRPYYAGVAQHAEEIVDLFEQRANIMPQNN